MNYLFAFFVISGLLAVLLFISARKQLNNNLRKIRTEWSDKNIKRSFEPLESISTFWSNDESKGDGLIDDLTWNDLSMDDVFEKLNHTRTSIGAEKLYYTIRSNNLNNPLFRNNKSLMKELNQNHVFRENIELILMKLGKKNFSNSSSLMYGVNDKLMKHQIVYLFLGIVPIISVGLFYLSPQFSLVLFLLSITINGFVYQFNRSRYEQDFNTLNYVVSIIQCAKDLSKIDHPFLKTIKKNLSQLKQILSFRNIISSNAGSTQELLLDYLRIFFLFDFIAYNRIVKKLINYHEDYISIWHTISDLDSFIAITYFRNNYSNYCHPQFTEKMTLKGVNLYHPLIKNPVKNSIEIKNNIIISGSNASGKSTFIKAVAINCILAQTINTVLADQFTMKTGSILTSMAITDNLAEGDSYFVAEIKSLKRMINVIREGIPCFTFIDEILRGTNTVERISASSAILKWILSKDNNLSIIATHDLELTDIAKDYVSNYHFREFFDGDTIKFDYKLKQGPSYTKNAIQLLKETHYPKDIIYTASKLSNYFVEYDQWLSFSEIEKSVISPD